LLLAENLAEAESFALYFSGSGASSSTPHLYISALATWPRKLSPCWGWKSQFPGIPSFRNASQGSTLLMTLNVNSTVHTVAVSPDGKHIVSGLSDKSVWVWDASTGAELKKLKGHTNWVTSVAFSPDGKHIVSGSNDNSVQVWDMSTGSELKELKGHTYSVKSVAFSPDGKHIVSGSYDKLVWV
jgi:WD40 repeat protein